MVRKLGWIEDHEQDEKEEGLQPPFMFVWCWYHNAKTQSNHLNQIQEADLIKHRTRFSQPGKLGTHS